MEEEVQHFVEVLESTKQALREQDSAKLKELSNQTIHSASIEQHTDSITIAVIIYTLSKLMERRETIKIKNWNKFVKKVNSWLSLTILSLSEGKQEKYIDYLEQIRKSISSISPNIKQYTDEVLRKASINKASKIYEHGISLAQAAKLLNITQWELSEYAGQATKVSEENYNKTLDIKKRAQMALEFFS